MGTQEVMKIKKLLEENGKRHTSFEHAPVYTSEQASDARGVALKTGVKSMIVKTENSVCCILLPGDRKIDMKKLGKILNAKKVSFAKPDEVFAATGCEIGSVHPFGNLMGLKTYMDRKVLDNDIVNFNVGLHTQSMSMSSQDLFDVVKPILADLSV
jgi:Ala-tRNA(Pro) deacylase